MKQINLFENMERLVNMGMECYQSDYFKYDKPQIIKNGAGHGYYWYIRDSGTELIRANELLQNKPDAMKDAKYWLSDAVVIAKVTVNMVRSQKVYGTLKLFKKEKMKRLINAIEAEKAA